MCGRFTLRTAPAAWTQEFLPLWSDAERERRIAELNVGPRYNIAPTQLISCIHSRHEPRRDWSLFRWGLVPPWAADLSIGNRMINARSETVAEKRSFKNAFRRRRCLIPADGYYEWMKTPEGKQPFWIAPTGGGVLAMAGLWECNRKLGDQQSPLESCTILTTSANRATREIHDRMPVFLDESGRRLWLDQDIDDDDLLLSVLRPAPDDWFVPQAVSTKVNSPRNDTAQCIRPLGEDGGAGGQAKLF